MLALPNPDLFVFMHVRKEAVLSGQIEGTQSSLQVLLACARHRRFRFDPHLRLFEESQQGTAETTSG